MRMGMSMLVIARSMWSLRWLSQYWSVALELITAVKLFYQNAEHMEILS